MRSTLLRVAGALALATVVSTSAIAQAPAGGPSAADLAKQQQQQQQTQPLNNQPVWKEVRSGFPQVTSLPGRETNVLIQPQGQTWRAMRVPIATAGGILIALVGYQLLQGKTSSVHTPSPDDNAGSQDAALGIAVSPLALPILAGPGAIATAMSFAAESTVPEVTRVLIALALVCAINLVAFLGSASLVRFLGQNGIKVVTRLMGLILAVIGTQMLIVGVRGAVAST